MKFYAYGIVHPDGRAWDGGDVCVCDDREVLQDEVVDPENGSQPDDDKLRVVALYSIVGRKRKKKSCTDKASRGRAALKNLMKAVTPELTGVPKNVPKSSWGDEWDAAEAALSQDEKEQP